VSVVPLSEASLPAWLRSRGLIGSDVAVRVEPAGDGNINWVRRVRAADGRSWIVKQAREALERFPEYRASTERIVFEHRWLEIARPLDRDGVCPVVLDFDEASRVLVLEDLGTAERLDQALLRGADVDTALAMLGRLLGAVHAATGGTVSPARFANREMRALHGEHIFALPFVSNDFPRSAALETAAGRVWGDGALVEIARRAHVRYLEDRGALLHGDVQAGNVLLAPRGPKLLDAEIAHVGDPAFDVGTLAGHLLLAGVGRGQAALAAPQVGALWRAYAAACAPPVRPAFADVARYAGLEVLRRTIGAARVAAVAGDAAGLAAIDLATVLIRRPPAGVEELPGGGRT
jgi:5-methylthioribose kinase